ncbi:hypothetical protein Taro_011974 [Colocasia esculenta]|uniref:Uncharacterized protein n=1 Tax=Colocasia esculenta TaxID=4460 RepID=A0A843U7V7_COLES|nr:hypothetical protein [Colocasia esculenta]
MLLSRRFIYFLHQSKKLQGKFQIHIMPRATKRYLILLMNPSEYRFCLGSVDTPLTGVDTVFQTLRQNDEEKVKWCQHRIK